jgi:hypothetical protein
MKKLGFLIVFIFLFYIVQYDIRHGTLVPGQSTPVSTQAVPSPSPDKSQPALPYINMKVKAGDTVLSIVEQSIKGPLPVPLDSVITDFKALNEGTRPEDIQIGKKYKFPLYNKE